MQCIKCDICGNYAKGWRVVNFSYWKDNKMVQVKEICSDCTEVLEQKIKQMVHEKNL